MCAVVILDITDITVEGPSTDGHTVNQNRSYLGGTGGRAMSLPVVPACPFVTTAPTRPTGVIQLLSDAGPGGGWSGYK